MGIAKNRPLLLLLLFVPGSSRASVRSTATDDREDLTFPLSLSLFVLLIYLGCSPRTLSCSTSVYTDIQPFTLESQFISFFRKLFVLGHRWCFCTALSRDHLSVKLSITLTSLPSISVVIKVLEVVLFICSSVVASTA